MPNFVGHVYGYNNGATYPVGAQAPFCYWLVPQAPFSWQLLGQINAGSQFFIDSGTSSTGTQDYCPSLVSLDSNYVGQVLFTVDFTVSGTWVASATVSINVTGY